MGSFFLEGVGLGVDLRVVFEVRFWWLDGARIIVEKNVMVSCCVEEKRRLKEVGLKEGVRQDRGIQ